MITRGSGNESNNAGPTDVALEQHYSPQQVAEMWGVHPNTIRRLFRGQPGVIEFGSEETRYKRRRKTMRIPESIVTRIHESWREQATRNPGRVKESA